MISNTKINNLKNSPPYFSVCIDLFNRKNTISKVLDSIKNQSCNDFELIIVDSGSNDGSLEICDEFSKKHPFLDIKIHKEEKKINEISGWNAPIKKAQGKYIAICEGDDYFHPDHLADAKRILDSNDEIYLYIAGSKITKFKNSYLINNDSLLNKLLIFEWCPPPSCSIFIRKLDDSNLNLYDENYIWSAEYDLYLRLLTLGKQTVINFSKNYIDRGYRFYLKNDYHISDMVSFYENNQKHYSPVLSKIARRKINERATQLFMLNLIYGKINYKLLSIIKLYSSSKIETFLLTVKFLPETIKTRIRKK